MKYALMFLIDVLIVLAAPAISNTFICGAIAGILMVNINLVMNRAMT